MSERIIIEIIGKAEPAGSKKPVPVGKKGEQKRWIVVDDNKKAKPWKEYVREVAREQYAGPILVDVPLVV